MRIHTILLSLALSLLSLTASAGAGHDHGPSTPPVSQSQAEAVAAEAIATLIYKGKIDSSWKSVKVVNAERKVYAGNTEWVISFKNETVTDPAKQTLYIFLTQGGEYIAANYTGE